MPPCTASTSSRSSAISASIGFIGARRRKPRERNLPRLRSADLRNHPEVPEKHVGRPHGVQVRARRVRNALEHHALVHADPHFAEHVLQEHVSFAFRRPAEEGLQQPTTHPRRVRPVRLRDLRETSARLPGCLNDRGMRLACFVLPRAFLSVAHPTFRARASDSAKMRPRFRWTAGATSSSEGIAGMREQRALLEALRRGLEAVASAP